MMLEFGLLCLLIWVYNYIRVIKEVLKYTPNWKDESMSPEDIAQNFLSNTTLEELYFIKSMYLINSLVITHGVFFFILAAVL